MPKCKSCKYLVREKGDYSDEWCHIFGYDTPDKYVAFEGEGCRCTQKFLKKLSDENDERDKKYWEQFADAFEKWGRNIDCEVLKDE